jgi:hypothetical protein
MDRKNTQKINRQEAVKASRIKYKKSHPQETKESNKQSSKTWYENNREEKLSLMNTKYKEDKDFRKKKLAYSRGYKTGRDNKESKEASREYMMGFQAGLLYRQKHPPKTESSSSSSSSDSSSSDSDSDS